MTTTGFIRYRSDYKYQLAEGYEINTLIRPKADINTEFIRLDVAGDLLVKKSYAWDGPSGPVKDTQENMRASLVHDALYQLMRNNHLKARTWRKAADVQFMEICKEDGVSSRTASLWYRGLRRYGKPSASPENKKKIARAPAAA
ncbi:MAG: DUF1353 domain-containing protein [Gammaproteobacteria bacterium]|jgi:hypothetical protein|nr:hypothetical protein [Chromatiales bacterium]MDP6675510.1 DUF1353 domain-containing protein [Gammaproteobacteria bacterium]